jgi:hypothetical protein
MRTTCSRKCSHSQNSTSSVSAVWKIKSVWLNQNKIATLDNLNKSINRNRRPKTHKLKRPKANRLRKLSRNQKTLVLANRRHVLILFKLAPWSKHSRARTPNMTKSKTTDHWMGIRSRRWGRSMSEGQRRKLSEVLFALTVTALKCTEARGVLTCT